VAAYMTDADLYAAGSKCVVNYLRKQLRKAAQTASRLDGYTLESTPSIAAATSSQMDRIAGKNWLAVGDAAAAFDPLSSQGIQSALTSGLRAAQSVERYLNGDRVALPSYASWVNKNFAEYLLIRNRFYRRELRWPRSLFWQRRQIGMPASCGLPRSAYGALSNPAS